MENLTDRNKMIEIYIFSKNTFYMIGLNKEQKGIIGFYKYGIFISINHYKIMRGKNDKIHI